MNTKEIGEKVSLVDFLADAACCTYVSDLTHLTFVQKRFLNAVLRKLPTSAASKEEWNEALHYIEGLPAQETAQEARTLLISALEG